MSSPTTQSFSKVQSESDFLIQRQQQQQQHQEQTGAADYDDDEQQGEEEEEEEEEEQSSFAKILLVFSIVACCGLTLGINIAISGSALVFENLIYNCSLYETAISCNSTSSCHFDITTSTCLFDDGIDCSLATSQHECEHNNTFFPSSSSSSSVCSWHSSVCTHQCGFTTLQLSLFTSLLCVGSLFITPFVERLTNLLGGRKNILVVTAIVSFVTAVTSHFAFWFNLRNLNMVLRVVTGSTISVQVIVTNLFLGEYLTRPRRRTGGALFQTSTTAGIFLVSIVGLLLKEETNFKEVSHLKEQFQGVLSTNTISSLLLTLLTVDACFFANLQPVNDSATKQKGKQEKEEEEEEEEEEDREEYNSLSPSSSSSSLSTSSASSSVASCCESYWKDFVAVICLPLAQQSSTNPIFSFAPIFAVNAGLAPLFGTVLISSFNFLCSIVAVLIAGKLPFKKTFLFGLAIAIVADVIIGVSFLSDGDDADAVAFVAALLFVFGFATFLSITYYPLASRAVSPPLREKGLALALAVEGVFSFSTSFFYPIFISTFNEEKTGIAISFIFFSACSVVAFISISCFLKTSRDYL